MDAHGLKEILGLVSKPVRYLGEEVNSVKKDPSQFRLKFCLAFPDIYEVGMSHLGIQILYHLLNSRKEVACERVFAPWGDMERLLREKKIPLSSLESSTPLNQFDILGFSLQYELSFTNLLNMLDLAGIPFLSKERDEQFPLVIAGGPTAFNPAPVADFFDAVVIGDGEEVILEICDLALQWKEARGKKEEFLRSLAQLRGVYIPRLHTENQKIHKRIVSDINQVFFPTCPIVPYTKLIHDRLNVEIARGCKRGCRFCEAGFIHRPYRERSVEKIERTIHDSLRQTGYEEFSLLSLSAGDYSNIGPLLSTLMDQFESKKVAVSFPSLRIESVVGYLAEEVKRVRKTGFTIAPEAGTERLRRVINKELDERVLFQGLSDLFSKGWKTVKLYFMIGLPTEREEDVRAIVQLSKKVASLGHGLRIHPNVNVSVSTFVPKPHTPFQWEGQIPLKEMEEKLQFLREETRRNRLQLKWQNPQLSFLEGIFSRGGQELSRVLMEAHGLGCRFDGWSDQFRFDLWKEAFDRAGMTMDSHSKRKNPEEPLPWSFIETGIKPSLLWEEYQRSLKEETSPPCVINCLRCGICDGKTVQVIEGPPAQRQTTEKVKREAHPKKSVKKKIRLRFTKKGGTRFISHLELAHLFYRAAKRGDLPLCHSEGFHPMPRIVFATALPVGVESLAETVDMELEGSPSPHDVMERLNQTLPPGIRITSSEEIPLSYPPSDPGHPSTYWISVDHLLLKEEAEEKIHHALERDEFILCQERKGKKRRTDIRPLIDRMEVMEVKERSAGADTVSGWGIELILRRIGDRSAKPTEIIGAILDLKEESLARSKVVKVK